MENKTFSAEQIRQAVRAYAARPKHSLNRLARESGVDWACLKRFVAADKGLTLDSVEKLWPILYAPETSAPPE